MMKKTRTILITTLILSVTALLLLLSGCTDSPDPTPETPPAIINRLPMTEETAPRIFEGSYVPGVIEANGLPALGSWAGGPQYKEDGGWVADGAMALDTEVVKYGEKSVRIQPGHPKNTSGSACMHAAFYIPAPVFEAGKTYTYQAWCKTEEVVSEADGAALSVWASKREHGNIESFPEVKSEVLSGTNDWTLLSLTFTVPEGLENDLICFNMSVWNTTGGAAWFDGLAVVDGDKPVEDFSLVKPYEEETETTTETEDEPEEIKNVYKDYGLTVSEDGTILLAGKPFYAFGENNYGTYARWTEDPAKDWFRESIPLFKEYNIPFIRCPFSGFAPGYYASFDADPEKYLDMMEEVVKCAEENELGLIVSLMWLQTSIPTHCGEKASAIGDPNSATVAYAKEYVRTVVERFKDSPAVWGWEIGNEYNLSADLCDPNFKEWIPTYALGETNGFDYVTSRELTTFYGEIAEVIREIDDFRLISNGNGEMRSFAYASHQSSENRMNEETHTWNVDWTGNTRDQFYEMCEYFTPDPMDTLSFHFQHATLGSSNPAYILEFDMFGEGKITLTEYLKAYAEAGKRMGKAVYFGEFGDMLDMDTAPDRAEKFQFVMDCISEAGIQLASAWHYQDVTTEGIHGENLEMIGAMNKKYQESGMQDLDAYWNPAS